MSTLRYRYLAHEVDSGAEVTWTEINVTDSDRELMVNWARFALDITQKAPSFLVKMKDFSFTENNKSMIIISECLDSISVKQFLETEYSNSRFVNDHDSYMKLIRKFVRSLTEYISVLSTVEPAPYLPMCSLRSVYISKDLENFKVVYLPMFLYQVKSSSIDCLRYLPYEVIEGGTPSIATTMYSLGICLLEMLTISRAFESATITTIVSQIRNPVAFVLLFEVGHLQFATGQGHGPPLPPTSCQSFGARGGEAFLPRGASGHRVGRR